MFDLNYHSYLVGHSNLVVHSNLVDHNLVRVIGYRTTQTWGPIDQKLFWGPGRKGAKFAPLGVPREDLDRDRFDAKNCLDCLYQINFLN